MRTFTLQILPLIICIHMIVVQALSIPYSSKIAKQTLHALESEDIYLQKQMKSDKLYPRMRPSPSDTLPVEPPNFPLGRNSLPSIADLDTFKLKKMLGGGFNADFMAVDRPREDIIMPNGTLDYSPGNSRGYPIKHMDSELKSLTVRIPGRRKKLKIRGARTKKRVLRFLSAYSYCPVHYQWKRMGKRFWPPWLKEGSCYQGRSCSIPPGMSCRPEKSTTLSVLWWHCSAKHKHCKWISIQYPIITSCTCAC